MPHLDQDSVVDYEEELWDLYFANLKEMRNEYGIHFETLEEAEEYEEWLNNGGKQDTEENPLLDLPLRFGPSRSSPFRLKSTAMDKKPKSFVRRENFRSATKARKMARTSKHN